MHLPDTVITATGDTQLYMHMGHGICKCEVKLESLIFAESWGFIQNSDPRFESTRGVHISNTRTEYKYHAKSFYVCLWIPATMVKKILMTILLLHDSL